jgi:tetratricopeptide (TPR) repeat protein
MTKSNVIHVAFGTKHPRVHSRLDREFAARSIYDRASGIDEDPARMAEATRLYEQAIELDPLFADAYVNLGSMIFHNEPHRQEEIIELFECALRVDERHSEALYNLGVLFLQRSWGSDGRGDDGYYRRKAIDCLQRAIVYRPGFADAHFNLALAYEASGDVARAARHWELNLEFEPDGNFADVARCHLKVVQKGGRLV